MNVPVNRMTTEESNEEAVGRYGRMRASYLKEHRPIVYNELLLSGKLEGHLTETDEAARNRIEALMPELALAAGATEELKAHDQMQWVGLMNACRSQAEEIVANEMIYN